MNKISKFIRLIGESMFIELKRLINDWGAILIFFIALIAYPLVYSLAYEKETVRDIPIALVDLNQSVLSRQYGRMVDETPELKVTHKPTSMEEAKELFFNEEVRGVIVIDNDFNKNVLENKEASVSVYADATYFLFYKQILVGSMMSGKTMGAGIEIRRMMSKGKTMHQAMQLRDPMPLNTIDLHNPFSGYGGFVMPGILIIIFQQTLLIGLGMMGGTNRKKDIMFIGGELGYKNSLSNNIAYILGKFGAYFLVYLMDGIFVFIWTYNWFQFPNQTSFIETLPLFSLFLFSTTMLGIAIGTLFKHREEAFLMMVFLSPFILFLTGISFPMESIPKFMNMVSYIMPSQAMVPAYLRLRTVGSEYTDIAWEMNVLYVQSIVYFVLAVFLMKRLNKQKI